MNPLTASGFRRPGPRSLALRPIVETFPYVPIAVRLRTGVAVLSWPSSAH